MTINPSTLERAKKHGVILTEDKEGYSAHWPKMNQRMRGASPKVLLDDMIALIKMRSNYKSFVLYNGATDNDGRPLFQVNVPRVGEFRAVRLNDAFVAAVSEWETKRAELEEEDDKDDDVSDSEYSGSVVSGRYRARYTELGHPTHCGDALAEILNNLVANRGGTNIELFIDICATNNVFLTPYLKNKSRGWQGRVRMTGRNILARRVYDTGILKLPEHLGLPDITMPKEWLEAQRFTK